jgi:protein-tyrosine phosphatase
VIDLHCHYLPGIDDGAQTLEESLELARAAIKAGIHVAVMTPHVHPGRYENNAASIEDMCAAFQRVLAHNEIPLELRAGGEVRISENIIRMVEEGEIPYLGQLAGYRVLLLEFPHSHLTVGAEKLVDWLLDRRIRPLIAHPERNKEVMRNPDKLRPLIERGCLLQLTGASIMGRFGKPAEECATQLIEREWASAVATDAHNLEHRPPCLDEAYAALARIGGEALALELTQHMPARIIGKEPTSTEPQATAQ